MNNISQNCQFHFGSRYMAT